MPVPTVSIYIIWLNQVIYGRMSEKQDARVTLLIDPVPLNVIRPG